MWRVHSEFLLDDCQDYENLDTRFTHAGAACPACALFMPCKVLTPGDAAEMKKFCAKQLEAETKHPLIGNPQHPLYRERYRTMVIRYATAESREVFKSFYTRS